LEEPAGERLGRELQKEEACLRPARAPVSCTEARLCWRVTTPSPFWGWLSSLSRWLQGPIRWRAGRLWHPPSIAVPAGTCHHFCAFKGVSLYLLSRQGVGFLASHVSFLSPGPSTEFCKPEDPEKEEKEGKLARFCGE